MKLLWSATGGALRFGIYSAGNERTRRKRPPTSTWQTSLAYNQMLGQNVINTFWFERPLWVAVDPFTAEEEAPEVEEFIYHRPVLENEVLELLEPKPGSLIVDATCGGGGHTEAFLETRANVLALDRDPELRYQSAREVRADLGGVQAGSDVAINLQRPISGTLPPAL